MATCARCRARRICPAICCRSYGRPASSCSIAAGSSDRCPGHRRERRHSSWSTPPVRELRLYQAEHLLRQYGFGVDELAFGADGNLPLDHDPKTAWALAHPEYFPLEEIGRA